MVCRKFLKAVKDRDISYVRDHVDSVDRETLDRALSVIEMTIKNFDQEDADYSDDIERLNEISDIINGA